MTCIRQTTYRNIHPLRVWLGLYGAPQQLADAEEAEERLLQGVRYNKQHVLQHLPDIIRHRYSLRITQTTMLRSVYSVINISSIVFAIPRPLPNPEISGLGFCNSGIPGLIPELKIR